MSRMTRVLVALSGGVDSMAAALALLEEGYEVRGVTFLLRDGEGEIDSMPELMKAKEASARLGIKHEVIDLRDEFYREVVDYFAKEYMRGRTPNPCVVCNRKVKFERLLVLASERGCELVATGHYARLLREGNRARLMRARDVSKDQSYVLYRLGQEILGRCIFPNGDRIKRELKDTVTRELGWSSHEESQDICFLAGGDYRKFLERNFPESVRPGPMLDMQGRELGRHRGLAFYTVGQRRGLGLSEPKPLYVVALDPSRNAVLVGDKERVPGRWLEAEEICWVTGDPVAREFEAEAMVRYNSPLVRCWVRVEGDRMRVTFSKKVWAITPGQHVVLYSGEEVLGGGIIARAG